MSRAFRLCAVLVMLPWIAAGCGGGGGGSSLGAGDRTAEVSVFATDGFGDDYDQVWINLYKVELLDSGGNAETVFADDAGRVLELRTLRDTSGERFVLLGDGRVRPGAYSSARVTIGETINAVPRGSATAQPIEVDAGIARDAQGHPMVQFSLRAPRNLSGPGGSLVVDFDLANFVLAGGRLRPALKEAISQLLPNPERHERNHFGGVVTGLSTSAGVSTFLLQLPNGLLLPVTVSSETVVFNADGAPNPELANGQRIVVEGAFDVGSRRFGATEIRVEPRGDDGNRRALVAGAPLSANREAGSFVIRIVRVEGFMPRTREITVNTTPETVFHNESGLVITRAEFFDNLMNAPLVKAAGLYNHDANTFTAYHARLLHDGHDPHLVRAVGKPVEINAAERLFWLNPIYEFEGFHPEHPSVRVVTTANTRFVLPNGEVVAAARFFELLPLATRVRVEGIYTAENNTITALLARITEWHDTEQQVSAAGPPAEIDPDHHRFDIRPVDEHAGFDVRDGLVHVQATEHTVFRGPDGGVITGATFFELLRNASRVRVEGAYNRDTNTITAAVAAIVAVRPLVVAIGTPVEVNADSRSFSINPVLEAAGFTPHEGRVKVLTTAETVFKDGGGHVISAADFFHLLAGAARVRVEGRYNADLNAITAAVAQIRAI